jgi:Flp pilus assembly protein TadG
VLKPWQSKMRRFPHMSRRIAADRRGGIGVTFGLMLVPILGITGAAIDYGRIEQFKTQLQATVDSAALSGAAAYTSSSENTEATTVATNYVTSNVALLPGHVGSVTPTVAASVVTTGSNPGYTVSVHATVAVATTFMRLIGETTLNVSASATAVNPTTNVCMLAVGSGSSSLVVNSGASLTASNCAIDVASTSSGAAVFNGSLQNVSGVCVAGTATVGSGSTVSNLTSNCTPASNPYSITAPSVGACTVNGANYGPGTVNLTPGTYCGHYNWNGPGTLNLACGLYILENDWTISESWTVNAPCVTFYFVNSSSYVDFNGSATVTLAPETTGTWANILMFEAPGLTSSTAACTGDGCFNISAPTSGNKVTGVIDLPSRNIGLQGGLTSTGLTIVANTFTLYGTMSWTTAPAADGITGAAVGKDYLEN